MIKVFTTKKYHPIFKLAETSYHVYPNFPQHIVKEKTWTLKDGSTLHRFYVTDRYNRHKEFISDLITDEKGVFPRAQVDAIYICDKRGHEWIKYTIRRNAL